MHSHINTCKDFSMPVKYHYSSSVQGHCFNVQFWSVFYITHLKTQLIRRRQNLYNFLLTITFASEHVLSVGLSQHEVTHIYALISMISYIMQVTTVWGIKLWWINLSSFPHCNLSFSIESLRTKLLSLVLGSRTLGRKKEERKSSILLLYLTQHTTIPPEWKQQEKHHQKCIL